jgi:type II secretory pathway pseudopilin PulG
MIGRSNKTPGDGDQAHPKAAPVGFTMVEMVVALGVACILMVAVVAFLVQGVVSTTKTTSINDATTKGRYVFEHLSREMARANDLQAANFTGAPPTPTPGTSNYQGFNYFISVEDQATTPNSTTPVTGSTIQLNLPAASPPDYLVPQPGDYIKLPGINLGTNGTVITGAAGSSSGGAWTITVERTHVHDCGCPHRRPMSPRTPSQRSFARGPIPSSRTPTTGDTQLWWYPNTTSMPTTLVVAKGLPTNPDGTPQYPFTPIVQGRQHEPRLRLRRDQHGAHRGQQPAHRDHAHGGHREFPGGRPGRPVEFLLEQHDQCRLRQPQHGHDGPDLSADADSGPDTDSVAVTHALADSDPLADPDADPTTLAVTVARRRRRLRRPRRLRPIRLRPRRPRPLRPRLHRRRRPPRLRRPRRPRRPSPTPTPSPTPSPTPTPYADSDAYTDPDALADADAFADADTVAHAYAVAHPDADADSVAHADAVADAVTHADADSYAHADTVAHPYAVADTLADAHAVAHAHTFADAYPVADPVAVADTDTVAHTIRRRRPRLRRPPIRRPRPRRRHRRRRRLRRPRHTLAHRRRRRLRRPLRLLRPHRPRPVAHTDAVTHTPTPDTFADTDPVAHADADSVAHTHAVAHADAHAFPDTVADTDAVAHPDADADTVAHPDADADAAA